MKKLASFISILCVLNVLLIAGLGGFLWGTGRLDKPKAQVIGDLLKRSGTPEHLREKVYDMLLPVTATQPATATAPASRPAFAQIDEDIPATAEGRIDYMRKLVEEQRLRVENEAQNLRHQQELLQRDLATLKMDQEKFQNDKAAFEAQLAASGTKKDDAGFQKMMTLFDELKAPKIKDLLVSMNEEEAVKYLGAMPSDQAAKVIGEFKSPTEKEALTGILERLRNGAKAPGTGAASGTPAVSNALSVATPPPAARADPSPRMP